jgi:hypothetical protein
MAYEIIVRRRRLPEDTPLEDEPKSSDDMPRAVESAANDNDIQWPLEPFPDGSQSS